MSLLMENYSSRAPKHTAKKRSRKLHRLIPLLLALAGIIVLLYPVVATIQKNYSQSSGARVYSEQMISEVSAEERAAELAEAHQWNTDNQGQPVLDPWLARITEDNEEYRGYIKQLDLNDVMARIIIPAINSDLPIYHGTTEEVLGKGVGHLFGTSLPVGGDNAHAVLTGHTGLSGATLWDNLTKVKEGDPVYIEVAGEKLKYEVNQIRVVLPDETSSLVPELGKDQITLITCTPYGVNSHRLLLTAQRVPMDPADEAVFNATHQPWQWWMTAVLVVVGFVLILFIIAIIRRIKKSKNNKVNVSGGVQ
ncbi:class C sortase [Corynebacterium callunae]|uniref:class C sortase n=1 Tax=Corynebacterium callunae TaxID=1721 RepID=UPI003982C91D